MCSSDLAQAAALESLKQQQRASNRKRGKSTHHSRHNRRTPRPAESQPAAQIAPKSYLGAALRDIGRSKTSRGQRSTSPSSPSSLSPSSESSYDQDEDSSLDSDDSTSGESAPGHQRRRRDNRHGRNKKRRRSSSRREAIRPIPPKEYDGAPDARAYHQIGRAHV